MTTEVIKSPADKKQYKLLKLSNGLTALLIHDPSITENEACPGAEDADGPGSDPEAMSDSGSGTDGGEDDTSDEGEDVSGSEGGDEDLRGGKAQEATKKAAAAMAVGVGSMSDPWELQGLSHYLEHMLFMGSEQWPDENEYDSYLTKHGGSSNAYTELEYTNYHFDVQPSALKGALQRFAQFFVAPLLRPDALEREVCAVDSEFVGVLQSDHARQSQLLCYSSSPGHVYTKFSWGNKDSLWAAPAAAGLDVRQELLAYYKANYGAERMSLVVLGGQTLEEMCTWVQQLFDSVPGGCGPPPSFQEQGLPFKGRTLYLTAAVKDQHEVSVVFQLPSLRTKYANKPDHYLSHLIGHEGPGSLLSCLKARGWATDITAGVGEDGYNANTCCYLFSVAITLTEAGLVAGPGYGLAAVGLLMQYIQMLREAGPQAWVWEELRSMSDMRWRYQEEEEAVEVVTRLAAALTWVQPQHVLVADYLHEAWEPQEVLELLGHMDPTSSSYRVDLLTAKFPSLKQQLEQHQQAGGGPQGSSSPFAGSAASFFTEPWFKVEAASVPLPDELVRSWVEAEMVPELALPPRNPYLPSDFSLKPPDEPSAAAAPAAAAAVEAENLGQANGRRMTRGAAAAAAAGGKGAKEGGNGAAAGKGQGPKRKRVFEEEVAPAPASAASAAGAAAGGVSGEGSQSLIAPVPSKLVDKPGLRLWHLSDQRFAQPRSHLMVRLASPQAGTSPRAVALQNLWVRLTEEALNEEAYMADVAGLQYSVSAEGLLGLEVRVDGFNHKLPVLAQRIFDCLGHVQVKEEDFPAVQEHVLRRYRNAHMHVAKAAGYLQAYALSTHAWYCDQVREELEAVQSIEEVKAYGRSLLSRCHLEVLITGNTTRGEAGALAQQLAACLGPGCSAAAEERPMECCKELPASSWLCYSHPAKNPKEDNTCVQIYFQWGPALEVRNRALVDLVDQITYEPCYNTLRTQQQLGYTVHSFGRLTYGVIGFCVAVVSPSHAAGDVEERIEAFLADFHTELKAMTQEEFSRHVGALISLKLQQDQSLGQEASRLWDEVWSGRYDFSHREAEVAVLRGLKHEDLLEFYGNFLGVEAPNRKKLSIRVLPRQGKEGGEGPPGQQQQDEGGPGAAEAGGVAGGLERMDTEVDGVEEGPAPAEAAAHVHHHIGAKHEHQHQHQHQHAAAAHSKDGPTTAGPKEGKEAAGAAAKQGSTSPEAAAAVAAALAQLKVVESLDTLRQQLPSYPSQMQAPAAAGAVAHGKRLE